jgi:AraC-like DNA-binding protein
VITERNEITWDGAPLDRRGLTDAMSTQGMQCRFDATHSPHVAVTLGSAGRTRVTNAELAWQVISPNPRRNAGWSDDIVFLKIVRCGGVTIEQKGQKMSFARGDLFFVDPQHGFNEVFCDTTQMSILHISKQSLRNRGLRHRFQSVHVPEQHCPDVTAVRTFLLGVTAQVGKASAPLLTRLGDQCLDLMDVVIGRDAKPAAARAASATTLRAKQLIARRIGDPDLDLTTIAYEMNLSASTLTRALKASGLSPMRYAWSLRLSHAARLLAKTPDGGIRDIAFQCGFASAAHFSRAFRERYGMTPREFAQGGAALHREAMEKDEAVEAMEAAEAVQPA